jgi:hypothetical protein
MLLWHDTSTDLNGVYFSSISPKSSLPKLSRLVAGTVFFALVGVFTLENIFKVWYDLVPPLFYWPYCYKLYCIDRDKLRMECRGLRTDCLPFCYTFLPEPIWFDFLVGVRLSALKKGCTWDLGIIFGIFQSASCDLLNLYSIYCWNLKSSRLISLFFWGLSRVLPMLLSAPS